MTARARATRLAHTLAGVLVVGGAGNLLLTLARAARLADGDTSSLLAVETRVAQLVRAGDLLRAGGLTWALIAPQPPAGYLPGIATFTLLGARPWGAWLSMGLVLAVGGWGLWRLWGTRAWMAGLVIVASPMTWTYVEQHGRDVVAGCVLLAMLGELHRTEGFRAPRPSFAYGAWLGIGFLTKYTFPMFAVGPTLAAGLALVAGSYRASAEERRQRWTNLGVAVGGFLLTAGAWYAARGSAVLSYAGFSMSDDLGPQQTANLRDPSSIESLAYYPLALRDALSLPGVALVGVALLAGVLTRATRGRTFLSFAAALSGVAVLSAAPAAIDRYAFPAFVALAALLPALVPVERDGRRGAEGGPPRVGSASAVVALRIGLAVAALAVFVPAYRASAARFAPGVPTQPARYEHPLASARDLAWPIGSAYLPTDLDAEAWHLDALASALVQAMGDRDGTFGFLGPRVPLNSPSYAQVLLATSARGGRYDVATVNLMYRPGPPNADAHAGAMHPVFVGPLFDGTWPGGDFDIAVVVAAPPDEGLVNAWLESHPNEVVARFPAPNHGWIGVVRMASTFRASAR